MDQIKLENQAEMVHPARMGPPSCWMDQKVSQGLLGLGDSLSDEGLLVSRGGKMREGIEE